MNRLWTTFVVIAIISVIVVIAYELIFSATGGNVTFSGVVTPISPDLGIQKLQAFKPLTDFQPLRDSTLDPTPTP